MSSRQLQFHLKAEVKRRPTQLELPFAHPFHNRQ